MTPARKDLLEQPIFYTPTPKTKQELQLTQGVRQGYPRPVRNQERQPKSTSRIIIWEHHLPKDHQEAKQGRKGNHCETLCCAQLQNACAKPPPHETQQRNLQSITGLRTPWRRTPREMPHHGRLGSREPKGQHDTNSSSHTLALRINLCVVMLRRPWRIQRKFHVRLP